MPYPCSFCSVVPQTPASSIRHQRDHAKGQKTFIFFCPLSDCNFESSTYNGIDFHISSQHQEARHIDAESTEELFCHADANNCSFSTTSLVLLVRHLYCHFMNGLHVVCPIEGCSHSCSTKGALKVHLSSYHPGWASEGCPKQSYRRAPDHYEENSLLNFDVEEDNEMQWEEFIEPETESSDNRDSRDELLFNNELFLNSIAKFYLGLYAVQLLAQTTIQKICDSIAFMTEVAHARMKVVLTRALEDLEISERKINRICHDVFEADLLYTSHHKNSSGPSLTSHYLRKKFFKEKFGYFGPVEIHLDENDPESEKKLQYVSVKKSLSVLFEDPSVQREIQESFSEQLGDDRIVSDYPDGYLFKSEDHPKPEIQLLLHQDAYNPVPNALGSAKNKYKALVVYFTIGNLKAHIRSKIITKHLVMIVRENIFKKVGAEKCLEELISELQALEQDGIQFMGETVPVTLEFMLGDSLGHHLIGGFIESFSVEFMCRFCEITRRQMKADPLFIGEGRTVAEFNRCALRAKLTGQHCKGIKASCEFNKLKNFHATSHLVPCIAHDCFEGAFSWDMAGIIRRFVKKRWFSLELINKRIRQFKCVGVDTGNKPAFVHKKYEKLGGHAVQNWTLIRLFYFIIGDKIQDFEDEGWLLYLKLKELCEYFCAPIAEKSSAPYMKDVLLPAYFDLRKTVLVNKKKYPIKPKHHFIAHYPDLLLRYGSLIFLWTFPLSRSISFLKKQ
ncbi:hypothetical protein FOCC_FOCC014245 [Frankliniella occidentalis]|uniref:Uncharacterized protein LOC127750907 n=1 Tax=Frankliniella occidentalis TaxID=133901 RepID=A0A9C6X5G3_FRAOC|nr:uncharacterized protein LOC127750907 [Frankliniella occidentalis]KAE8740245.1 hypothetical protein FOCC_FOCC014245 [Frankliniella occidentalis]